MVRQLRRWSVVQRIVHSSWLTWRWLCMRPVAVASTYRWTKPIRWSLCCAPHWVLAYGAT